MLGNALDVLVVGAGPAGVAAGIEARRLGLDVLVVDKAGFPRDKTCGDGLTTGALRLLDALGVDVRSLPSYAPIAETVLVSPTGRDFTYRPQTVEATQFLGGSIPRLQSSRYSLIAGEGVRVPSSE